jgi:dienelactone hydrolase
VGSMQHDLSDAVGWAVDRGIADPKRVCIMGSSYGGYATFAGEQLAAALSGPAQCSVGAIQVKCAHTTMHISAAAPQ